jgi:hypothetical protein
MKTPMTILVMLFIAPQAALADGVVLRSGDLGEARAALEARVAEARARDAQAFAMVRAVDAYRPEGYRRTRGQRPSVVGLVFRRMGARALWPLVEMAALDGPSHAGLSDAEWRALGIGLLDAIGAQRELQAAPLLRAAFVRASDAEVAGAAAVGLGALGDRELQPLIDHARANDPLLIAAVRGLGASRRPRAVERLGALLDQTGDAQLAAELVAALGEAGSSWAWATGRVGTAEEGVAVRRACAAALERNAARLSAAAPHFDAALRRVDASHLAR